MCCLVCAHATRGTCCYYIVRTLNATGTGTTDRVRLGEGGGGTKTFNHYSTIRKSCAHVRIARHRDVKKCKTLQNHERTLYTKRTSKPFLSLLYDTACGQNSLVSSHTSCIPAAAIITGPLAVSHPIRPFYPSQTHVLYVSNVLPSWSRAKILPLPVPSLILGGSTAGMPSIPSSPFSHREQPHLIRPSIDQSHVCRWQCQSFLNTATSAWV